MVVVYTYGKSKMLADYKPVCQYCPIYTPKLPFAVRGSSEVDY